MTRRSASLVRGSLIALHRWLGVLLALNFFIWFLSGLAMMYWDFPTISPSDRLAHAQQLDPRAVHVTVAEAFAATGLVSADEVRLEVFDGRPVYRIRSGGTLHTVYADIAELPGPTMREQVDRLAAAWTRRATADARVRAVDDVDQWTVQLPLARLKPLWQYSWPNGDEVYVSQASGEVVQYTTRASRLGAYIGAIPHWLYLTSLRKNGPLWSRIVIALSGVGTIVAMMGVTIGLWTWSPGKRYRRDARRSHWPYRGWKRWHAMAGLSVGIAAVTWAFSGMLSMDPFPLPGDPPHTDDVGRTLRGSIEPAAFQRLQPGEALSLAGSTPVKQLELVSSSESFYVVTFDGGRSAIVDLTGAAWASLAVDQIAAALGHAVQPDRIAETRVLDEYDRYYLDRRRARPLPVVMVRLSDRDASRFYIDPATSRLVAAYGARNWATRWLYHGLHSLDFPWLYRYRPLWDVIVGGFMLAGSALCFTSLVLAWQVLGRTLGRVAVQDENK